MQKYRRKRKDKEPTHAVFTRLSDNELIIIDMAADTKRQSRSGFIAKSAIDKAKETLKQNEQ